MKGRLELLRSQYQLLIALDLGFLYVRIVFCVQMSYIESEFYCMRLGALWLFLPPPPALVLGFPSSLGRYIMYLVRFSGLIEVLVAMTCFAASLDCSIFNFVLGSIMYAGLFSPSWFLMLSGQDFFFYGRLMVQQVCDLFSGVRFEAPL